MRCAPCSSRPVGPPGPDAERVHRDHRTRGWARPRGGRLPDQAVRLRRADRPDPRTRSAVPTGGPTGARARRHPPRSAPPHGHSGRPAGGAVTQGVRGARRVATSRGRRGLRRTAAGEGMGRTCRPVHRRGPVDDHEAAPQAGGPEGHRNLAGPRLPDRLTMSRHRSRSTIRLRLTALYAGAFLVAGAALVVSMYVILGEALDDQLTARIGVAGHLPELGGIGPESTQAAHEAQDALRDQFEQDRDDTLGTMLTASLVALGGVGVIAALLGWFVAARGLRPLQQITSTARRGADRNLHERIDLDGPQDEIKDLADTFDAMLERLDRAFDSPRRFVANASHELRTPLTINRTLIEVALENPDAGPPPRPPA